MWGNTNSKIKEAHANGDSPPHLTSHTSGQKIKYRGWRDGSVVRSTNYSSEDPDFIFSIHRTTLKLQSQVI